MSYVTKNYTEPGGENTVIGGKLTVNSGARIVVSEGGTLELKSGANMSGIPAATAVAIGGVKKGTAVADAAGSTPTAAEFNALLAALRTAGIIEE